MTVEGSQEDEADAVILCPKNIHFRHALPRVRRMRQQMRAMVTLRCASCRNPSLTNIVFLHQMSHASDGQEEEEEAADEEGGDTEVRFKRNASLSRMFALFRCRWMSLKETVRPRATNRS